MERLYEDAQAWNDDAMLIEVERVLRLSCQQQRALAFERLRPKTAARSITLWMAEQGRVVCRLVTRAPYCHNLTLTNRANSAVWWCRSYVVRLDAFPEAETLRRVFNGVAVQ